MDDLSVHKGGNIMKNSVKSNKTSKFANKSKNMSNSDVEIELDEFEIDETPSSCGCGCSGSKK